MRVLTFDAFSLEEDPLCRYLPVEIRTDNQAAQESMKMYFGLNDASFLLSLLSLVRPRCVSAGGRPDLILGAVRRPCLA